MADILHTIKAEDLLLNNPLYQQILKAIKDNTLPPFSTVSLSFQILAGLIDECIMDTIGRCITRHSVTSKPCSLCNTLCCTYVDKPGLDVFGNDPSPGVADTYHCLSCQRSFPPARYASHLEKCLGIAGRSAGRSANLRVMAKNGHRRSSASPSQNPNGEESGKNERKRKSAATASSESNRKKANGNGDKTQEIKSIKLKIPLKAATPATASIAGKSPKKKELQDSGSLIETQRPLSANGKKEVGANKVKGEDGQEGVVNSCIRPASPAAIGEEPESQDTNDADGVDLIVEEIEEVLGSGIAPSSSSSTGNN